MDANKIAFLCFHFLVVGWTVLLATVALHCWKPLLREEEPLLPQYINRRQEYLSNLILSTYWEEANVYIEVLPGPWFLLWLVKVSNVLHIITQPISVWKHFLERNIFAPFLFLLPIHELKTGKLFTLTIRLFSWFFCVCSHLQLLKLQAETTGIIGLQFLPKPRLLAQIQIPVD